MGMMHEHERERDVSGGYLTERLRDMAREIEESGKAHQQAAIIQERMLGMLNDHDRRIQALEKTPESWLHGISQSGGCLSQLVTVAISSIALLTSAVGIIWMIVHG